MAERDITITAYGTKVSSPSEAMAGVVGYLDFLAQVHAALAPRRYLEIGVRHGASLALAQCPALGVDPAPALDRPLPERTRMIETTSDRFFADQAETLLQEAPDLIFVDGMHLFEYALRDILNAERFACSTSVILVDDIFPNHADQARRERCTRVWTGDVWKLAPYLAQARSDLVLLPLDTHPTGLMLILGLDPDQGRLDERQQAAAERQAAPLAQAPPPAILSRQGVVHPEAPCIVEILHALRTMRAQEPAPAAVRSQVRAILDSGRCETKRMTGPSK